MRLRLVGVDKLHQAVRLLEEAFGPRGNWKAPTDWVSRKDIFLSELHKAKAEWTDTIVLPYDRMSYGLKQIPHSAPWDGETMLYGSGVTAEFGVLDGWYWATDRSTGLLESTTEPDLDHRKQVGAKIIELADKPLPDPAYLWPVKALALVGGWASTQLGTFDLDRVSDAVFWVACTDDGADGPAESVKVSVDGQLLRLSHGNRLAAVMCGAADDEHFFPTFDLPLEPTNA